MSGDVALDERARRRDVARGAHDRDARRPLDERGQAVGDRRVVLDDRDPDQGSVRLRCRRIRARSKHLAAFHTLPQRAGRHHGSRRVGSPGQPFMFGDNVPSPSIPRRHDRTIGCCMPYDDSGPGARRHLRRPISLSLRSQLAAAARRSASGRRTVMTVPLPISRGRLDLAAVGRHDLAGDVQAEAQARRPMRVARAACRRRTSSGCPRPRRPGRGPGPSTSARPSVRSTVTSIGPEPGACSVALARRFRNTCSSRPGSARTRTGSEPPLTRIGGALGTTWATSTADRTTAAQIDDVEQQLQLAALDAADVEEALDQRRQATGLGQRAGRVRAGLLTVSPSAR